MTSHRSGLSVNRTDYNDPVRPIWLQLIIARPVYDHMLRDRVKWNAKYRQHDYPQEPSAIVRDFYHMAPGRSALDLAAGAGRNSVFLAEQGFSVDAVDVADAGLALFAGSHPRLRPICADLDAFDIPRRRYDLIVNVLYVNRRLFPQIQDGLKPGGLLLFESLLETPDRQRPERALPGLFPAGKRVAARLSQPAGRLLPRGRSSRPRWVQAPGGAGGDTGMR